MATKKKYVYRFTATHGPEDFPTLGRTLTKKGELHESDVEIDHPRLQLVVGEKKARKPKSRRSGSAPEVKEPEAKVAEVEGKE